MYAAGDRERKRSLYNYSWHSTRLAIYTPNVPLTIVILYLELINTYIVVILELI
jgi:hypothetical protein